MKLQFLIGQAAPEWFSLLKSKHMVELPHQFWFDLIKYLLIIIMPSRQENLLEAITEIQA